MKTISKKLSTLLFILILVFIFIGCKKLNIEKELRIDIGTQFNNDYVIIKLDNKVIFSDSVYTSQTLGVAKILVFDHPVGRYEISVNINGVETKESFRHKKNRFIYIAFDKISSKITIIYPDEKYIYD
ncbi:MAG: hypothetical protein A2046_06570 [Bacteroidetes bacterium GWA2_30_7]|nr:MAG: hypothetical protein A2046_06570 [Bacteroidetes bacterium GWA2_30_7]